MIHHVVSFWSVQLKEYLEILGFRVDYAVYLICEKDTSVHCICKISIQLPFFFQISCDKQMSKCAQKQCENLFKLYRH